MLMLVLRFTHVFFGALWAGMMAYQAFFLMPSLGEAGPDAAKVMAALAKRRIPLILPILALLTLGSGTWLLMRLMGGGGNAALVMRTPMGRAYGWGGTAAIVSFLLGIILMRPAMVRSMRLAQSLASVSPEERPKLAAEIQRLRVRAVGVGRVVTILLLFALAAMAVARYL
jgi:hypothetical protein